MPVPARPKVFHITHVDNLRGILGDGGLMSDAVLMGRSAAVAGIGMSSIKQRRLMLPVRCHPGDHVGDCVPFYFCPRSIMLFLIHCANHPDLTYRGGQGPVVHLEFDLHDVVTWAVSSGRHWAFSLSNAGSVYAEFRSRLDQLVEIDWDAVEARDFRPRSVKEGKQAEFLVHGFVPWQLVSRIGAYSWEVAARASGAISAAVHQPPVAVLPEWYY